MRPGTSSVSVRGTSGSGFSNPATCDASVSVRPWVTLPRIIRNVSGNPSVTTIPVRAPVRVMSVLSDTVHAWKNRRVAPRRSSTERRPRLAAPFSSESTTPAAKS